VGVVPTMFACAGWSPPVELLSGFAQGRLVASKTNIDR